MKDLKIDKKKLKAAINEVSRNRKNPQLAPQLPEPWSVELFKDPSRSAAWSKHWDDLNAFRKANSAERATALCSLMAASRGKLHVTKEWVPTYLADGSQKLVVRTLEDQDKLIAGVLKEFVAPYWVVYEVTGFGVKLAGPYQTPEMAQSQRDDIAGYEGVTCATVTESRPPFKPNAPAAGLLSPDAPAVPAEAT